MDPSRFDHFTRALAAPSRRSLLGSAGASALAALLGWEGADACQGDLTCVNGQCACADPADTRCGTACVDLQTDDDHCGRCGNPCTDGQRCVAGACVAATCSPPCTGGQWCCYVPVFDIFACRNCCDDDDCLDDPLAVSQGRTICNGFACECPPEAPDNCGGTAGCVDLQNDPAHCGFCNRPVCGPPGNPACDGWECCHGVPRFTRGCTAGFGGWVECQTQHCGSCDNPCDIEGRGCCEGKCVDMVEGLDANGNCGFCGANCGDLTCCGARCVNTDNDQFNCGECGKVCEGTHACCHGECKRLGTPENCRGCDNECEENQVCVNSSVGCVSP